MIAAADDDEFARLGAIKSGAYSSFLDGLYLIPAKPFFFLEGYKQFG